MLRPPFLMKNRAQSSDLRAGSVSRVNSSVPLGVALPRLNHGGPFEKEYSKEPALASLPCCCSNC